MVYSLDASFPNLEPTHYLFLDLHTGSLHLHTPHTHAHTHTQLYYVCLCKIMCVYTYICISWTTWVHLSWIFSHWISSTVSHHDGPKSRSRTSTSWKVNCKLTHGFLTLQRVWPPSLTEGHICREKQREVRQARPCTHHKEQESMTKQQSQQVNSRGVEPECSGSQSNRGLWTEQQSVRLEQMKRPTILSQRLTQRDHLPSRSCLTGEHSSLVYWMQGREEWVRGEVGE